MMRVNRQFKIQGAGGGSWVFRICWNERGGEVIKKSIILSSELGVGGQ